MSTLITQVELGCSVADGEDETLSFRDQLLTVAFTDWREEAVALLCHDTVAFKWQEAENFVGHGERNDSVYEIGESPWLKQHQDQGCLPEALRFHHYELNFNAAGVLEILCSRIENKTEQA